jgi:uncharacterized protein
MDKLVHFEIPIDNIDRAKKFYGSIFGWGLKDWAAPDGKTYVNITTVPVDENFVPKEPGAINGDMALRNEIIKVPVVTINVDSINEYLEKITSAGGSVVLEKQEIPTMGFYAYFKDTEGNVMGLWENASS